MGVSISTRVESPGASSLGTLILGGEVDVFGREAFLWPLLLCRIAAYAHAGAYSVDTIIALFRSTSIGKILPGFLGRSRINSLCMLLLYTAA